MEARIEDLEKRMDKIEEKTNSSEKEVAVLKERIENIIQSQKETKSILFGVLGSVGMVLIVQIIQIAIGR